MMDIEAAYLLQLVREDMRATSERQHRDARRQHALHRASLMLGTGRPADEVKDQLLRAGLVLRSGKRAVTYESQRRAR